MRLYRKSRPAYAPGKDGKRYVACSFDRRLHCGRDSPTGGMHGLLILIVPDVAAETAVAVRKRPAGRRREYCGRANLQNALLSRRATRRAGRELCDERLHAANSVGPSAPGQRVLAVHLCAKPGRCDAASGAKAGSEATQTRATAQGGREARRRSPTGSDVGSDTRAGPSACNHSRQCFPAPTADAVTRRVAFPNALATANGAMIEGQMAASDVAFGPEFWTLRALSGTIADYLKRDG
jgi:hypothetical protein